MMPVTGGERELVNEPAVAPEAGRGDCCKAIADGDLDRGPEHAPLAGIGDDDLAAGSITDDDPAVGEREPDDERGSADEVDDRDQDEQQARPGERDKFDPVEQVSEQECEWSGDPDRPAKGRDDRPDALRCPHGLHAGASESTHDGDDDVGNQPGTGPDDLGARVGEAVGRRRGRRLGARHSRDRAGAPAARRGLDYPVGHTACRSLGGAVSMSSWPITLSEVTPSNSASGSRRRRCASTGSASTLTSSGIT